MARVNPISTLRSTPRYELLEELVRERAQEFIQDILEEEMDAFLGRRKSERTGTIDAKKGYRNGFGKPRRLALMNGTLRVRRPRVRNTEEKFESKIIPMFVRRTRQVGDLIPELYLHGLAKGDFELALRGLLGEGAPLSVASIQRLKAKWELEYQQWKRQDLSEMKLVYQWADGLYVKAGLEKEKAALLIMIGVGADGKKGFLSCESGYRESKESWAEILRDLKSRGLKLGRLTIADGHLGIWSALSEIHPEGEEQRCWNHKIANVINAMPKTARALAKQLLAQMPYAETKEECEKQRDQFIKQYKDRYPKATKTLQRDWDRMVTFYAFPKDHWQHIRTTNVVESPFHAVRLRTDAAKRYKKVQSATVMIWKLLMVAEKSFNRLHGYKLLEDVYRGKTCVDGQFIEQNDQEKEAA